MDLAVLPRLNCKVTAPTSYQGRKVNDQNAKLNFASCSLFPRNDIFSDRKLRVKSRKEFSRGNFVVTNQALKTNDSTGYVSKINGTAPNISEGKQLKEINGMAESIPFFTKALRNAIPLIVAGTRTLERKIYNVTKTAEEMANEITKKKRLLVQTFKGRFLKNNSIYRQIFVIRSYEVGFDKMASIETFANLFQIALNHASGIFDSMGDAMGSSHAMMKHRLIWVITKLHIQVDRYPLAGDVVEIDTCMGWSGKNGVRRDYVVRDYNSGEILCTSTSSLVIINRDSRRISRIPNDVRDELSSYLFDTYLLKDDLSQRIAKMDECPLYIKKDLVPKLHDIDSNRHVNNVKYIQWLLESVPQHVLVAYDLRSMTMEFRKESSDQDIITSMAHPCFLFTPSLSETSDNVASVKYAQSITNSSNSSHSLSESALSFETPMLVVQEALEYMHSLRRQSDGREILRAKSTWRLKQPLHSSNIHDLA
ncbi:hypothetical protein O6H91_Y139900 [Diphasiastrum complanatum]|nr:hypothetical protein O6H91_Y139900 [Diphasiastrum complanatum]